MFDFANHLVFAEVPNFESVEKKIQQKILIKIKKTDLRRTLKRVFNRRLYFCLIKINLSSIGNSL